MRFANVSKLEAAESESRQAVAVSAIADAREAFLESANDALEKSCERAGELEGTGFDGAKDDVHSLFHDLKGAGGGVGLNLLSQIASLGADFVRSLDAPTPGASRRAAAHIAAAKGVLSAGIEGDGGDAGDVLIEKLKNAQAQLQNSASYQDNPSVLSLSPAAGMIYSIAHMQSDRRKFL
jgi:hypothetical protein